MIAGDSSPAVALSSSPIRGGGCAGWAFHLLRLAKANGVFAVSEICKGVAIVAIGDMVIADEIGELVSAVALTMGAPFTGP
jgi:hypothetical protein